MGKQGDWINERVYFAFADTSDSIIQRIYKSWLRQN